MIPTCRLRRAGAAGARAMGRDEGKTPVDFGFEAFRSLLGEIGRAGYGFRRFDQGDGQKKTFRLRHDVDFSPMVALRLGEIAAEEDAVSNFFFQFNAETYTLFSAHNLEVITRLRAMGHCVGLHIDQALMASDEDTVARTIDWFGACVTEVDRVVSFHRPTEAVLGRRYERFINAYDPRFFSQACYLSDSRRQLAFWPVLRDFMAEGRTPLQLLLHPVWWAPQDSVETLWQAVRARRENELARYVLANCGKVFSGVVDDEDRSSGL
jgi:hypothetical protein